ncbi:hypothetical protein K440DRAFT_638399 [Wilcoxina mikolae CBS 423.85]|nr:hypothetical protein K440DRAFT_638399 [Wilcoxina mikolae CBS 423.85]
MAQAEEVHQDAVSITISEETREVADELRRKLAASEALNAYQRCIFERRHLDALDAVRPLQNRLAYIEPLYAELYEEYISTLQDVSELEEKEAELLARQEKTEALLRTAQNECAAAQGKLRAVRKELLDIRGTTKSSAATLVAERNSAVSDLDDAKLEHQLVKERSKALEAEVEQAEVKAKALQSEIADCKKELKSLQTKHDKALKQAASERKELEAQIERQQQAVSGRQELEAQIEKLQQAASERKELETQIEKLQQEAAGRKGLEAQIESLEAEKIATEEKLNTVLQKEESSKTVKKEISELKAALTRETKAREKAEKNIARLEAEQEKAAQMEEAAIPIKKELSELKATLTKETKAREKVEQDLLRFQETREQAVQNEDTSKATKKELSDLRTALAKESQAREKIEREFATYKTNQETKYETLKKQLDASKAKLKEAKAEATAARTTTTKVPLDNPRKRPISNIITMETLESAKKPRKDKPSTTISELSLTPFLKRQAVVDSDASTTGDITAVPGDGTIVEHPGDKSIIMPPPRLLLAGANRKKKSAAKAIVEEPEEEAPAPERAPTPPAPAAEEDEDIGEDSMLMPIAPIIKEAKPKAKPRGKTVSKPAAKTAPKPTKPKNTLLSSSPAEKQPARRRKKVVGETSFMGIKPTTFDDEDGTGRINMNLDDGSQGLTKGGRLAPSLATTLRKEISPPKRRPAALGGLFGKKS